MDMTTAFEVILQTLLAFFSILFITRVLGRKQLAQLTVHEYINGITFGSIAGTLATDINQRTWQHLIGLVLFGLLTYIMSYITMKNRKASQIIEGEPTLVIEEGKILEKNLSKYHYTVDDLNHLLRTKDMVDIKKIKYGILETTGELSIIKISSEENVKISNLNLIQKEQDLPTEIVITGNMVFENLRLRNISVKWLLDQLRVMGIKDIKEVYFASIDKENNIYVDRMDDHQNTGRDIED